MARNATVLVVERDAKRKAASRLRIGYEAVLYEIKDCAIVDARDADRIAG